MSKFGLYSDNSAASITFESHLEGLEEETKMLLLDLRNFVKSLGDNVIEEIRPHRIAYAKSLTFRTFLDIQPKKDYLNFDSIYAYDHLIPHYKDDIEKNIFECFTLLSSLAVITKKVKIGQIVVCNSYRNPSLLAKMLSTLDIISSGRVELGIGAGWYEQEYVAYGYDFASNRTRIMQLDESLSILKAMWTEKYASFEGKYYKIKDAICNPKPIQKPHPLIMVGGSGEKYLLKVVARHADRYNLFFGSPDEIKRKISLLKEYCSSVGRNYE